MKEVWQKNRVNRNTSLVSFVSAQPDNLLPLAWDSVLFVAKQGTKLLHFWSYDHQHYMANLKPQSILCLGSENIGLVLEKYFKRAVTLIIFFFALKYYPLFRTSYFAQSLATMEATREFNSVQIKRALHHLGTKVN